MIEDDVLVIGGGLAGATAALAAARTGAAVRVVSREGTTLRHASGLIDALGYAPSGEGPVVDPFDAIDDLPAGHPYERVGVGAVRDGFALFDDAVDGYDGDHTDRNALVPTAAGTVKPTARYPASVAPGLASDSRDCLLVGFGTLPDLDAPLAAARLRSADVPFAVRGVTVSFPGDRRADAKVTRYARALDRDEDGARGALAGTIEPHLDGAERVGLPAVLGDAVPDEVRAALEDALGVAVFEVPGGPPSLPGTRLERRLRAALDRAGVRLTTGDPVVDFEAGDGRVRHVVADREGTAVRYRADEFVLATGGLVGGGIDSDRERVREPVFGCHVSHPDDRYDWSADAPFGDHAFARFGVSVDRALRPLDADGAVEYANLRAAGGVLAGADFAAEKSGGGVSLATGYAAGTRAGMAVTGRQRGDAA